jgi:predicted nucleic acid-binding protein
MPRIAVYDACVLHPAPVRDLLLRLAVAGVVRARWTERILDECFASIRRVRPDLPPERLAQTRDLINRAVPDCLVGGYERLGKGLSLPDPDDRHVLAAAIRAHAQVIVTYNLSDFPEGELSRFGVEARHPDAFVLELLDLDADAVCGAVREQAAALRNPLQTVAQLLGTLQACGLSRSVALLRELLGPGGVNG